MRNARMPLGTIPPFGDDGALHVVVESPRGSAVKLKYDRGLGAMTVSRPLPAGLVYPYDWGFVPGTCASDGDPLDALVVWDVGTAPGVVIPCRALGILEIEQNRAGSPGRERNDRVLAVPRTAPRLDDVGDVFALPQRVREEIAAFFVQATAFERKDVAVLGWGDAAAALALVRRSLAHEPPARPHDAP